MFCFVNCSSAANQLTLARTPTVALFVNPVCLFVVYSHQVSQRIEGLCGGGGCGGVGFEGHFWESMWRAEGWCFCNSQHIDSKLDVVKENKDDRWARSAGDSRCVCKDLPFCLQARELDVNYFKWGYELVWNRWVLIQIQMSKSEKDKCAMRRQTEGVN